MFDGRQLMSNGNESQGSAVQHGNTLLDGQCGTARLGFSHTDDVLVTEDRVERDRHPDQRHAHPRRAFFLGNNVLFRQSDMAKDDVFVFQREWGERRCTAVGKNLLCRGRAVQ
jgi:hypothetical protein